MSVSVRTACVLIIRFQCFPIRFSIKLHVIAELKGFKDSVSLVFYLRVSVLCFLCKPPRKPLLSQQRRGSKRKGWEQFSCVYWLHQIWWSLRSDIVQLSIFWLVKTELIDFYSGIHHSKQAFQTPLTSLFKPWAKICFGVFVLWTWIIIQIVWLVSFYFFLTFNFLSSFLLTWAP